MTARNFLILLVGAGCASCEDPEGGDAAANLLSPSDDAKLTAIQLYTHQGSNSLAVKGVELCGW